MDHGDLKECCKKFLEKKLQIKSGLMLYNHIEHTFISGLAAFRLYRETRDSSWMDKGSTCTKEMRVLAEQGCSWNFHHKLLMLEAEDHLSKGNVDAAKESFKNAIVTAQTHRFLNDEALACELTARFYLDNIGDLYLSLQHFRSAHDLYRKWGAVAKASQIFTFTNEKFANLLA
jgi:hypothetical protein